MVDTPELDELVLESLPDDVTAALEIRDRWRAQAAASNAGLEFLVSHLDRWPAGSVVRVAFLSGSTELHKKIEDTVKEITDACNLTIDFGFDEASGSYRQWSTSDIEYQAEIRISFDMGGFFSLVGTDSNDPGVGSPFGAVGGRSNQRSLNLGGFDSNLPATWQGTTLHEFMHALAFQHEHQNMRGPCQDEFRWEDDPGYVPTMDQFGQFIVDGMGRRPGIYTFLAGAPNNWPKSKVDHNLRSDPDAASAAGLFDAMSVMLYRFPPLFYKTDPSECAPGGDGQSLSDGDKEGLDLLYPSVAEAMGTVRDMAQVALENLPDSGEEAVGAAVSVFEARAADLVRAHIAAG